MKSNPQNVTKAEIAALVRELRKYHKGLSARGCSIVMKLWDLRRIRAIAAAARPRIVSFPGSNGYRLIEYCDAATLLHAARAMRSQARKLNAHARAYDAARNAR